MRKIKLIQSYLNFLIIFFISSLLMSCMDNKASKTDIPSSSSLLLIESYTDGSQNSKIPNVSIKFNQKMNSSSVNSNIRALNSSNSSVLNSISTQDNQTYTLNLDSSLKYESIDVNVNKSVQSLSNLSLSKDFSFSFNNFSTPWSKTNSNVAGYRDDLTGLSFNDKLWIIGGYVKDVGRKNDVYYSTNGISWVKATSNASWAAREGHSSVVFDNKMWVIGGLRYSSGWIEEDDVWYSSDGINWTESTSSASWTDRYYHSSIVYNSRIWVIGGQYYSGDYSYQLNDVWYSDNGSSWIRATSSAGWDKRHNHCSVNYNGKMWILGGIKRLSGTGSNARYSFYNDVWYSSNGVSWTQATSNANWSDRWGHKCLVFEDKIWVLGGQSDGETKNDVWYSTDGKNWTQVTSSADWSARKGFANTVYNNKIWIIGGSGWDSSSSRTFSPDAWFW